MSAGDETYVLNSLGAAQTVEELYVFDGLQSRKMEELYVRNPLSPGGYDIVYYNATVAVPDVTIVSVTEPAVEEQAVIQSQTTGLPSKMARVMSGLLQTVPQASSGVLL